MMRRTMQQSTQQNIVNVRTRTIVIYSRYLPLETLVADQVLRWRLDTQTKKKKWNFQVSNFVKDEMFQG